MTPTILLPARNLNLDLSHATMYTASYTLHHTHCIMYTASYTLTLDQRGQCTLIFGFSGLTLVDSDIEESS